MAARKWLAPHELAALPEEHETRTDHFLAGTVSPFDERDERKFRRFEPYGGEHFEDVPISRLRGGQNLVDTHRVYDLASHGPADTYDHAQAPPQGHVRHDDTVMLADGHHRAAAAVMRGEQFMRVKLTGKYSARYGE